MFEGGEDVKSVGGLRFGCMLWCLVCRSSSQVSLDSLGLEEVDAIKIDVEGSEEEALRGAAKLLSQQPKPLGGNIWTPLKSFGTYSSLITPANACPTFWSSLNVCKLGSAAWHRETINFGR